LLHTRIFVMRRAD